jgi:hypothetical protein
VTTLEPFDYSNHSPRTVAFCAGYQQCAYESYAPNIAAVRDREAAEAARLDHERWHE